MYINRFGRFLGGIHPMIAINFERKDGMYRICTVLDTLCVNQDYKEVNSYEVLWMEDRKYEDSNEELNRSSRKVDNESKAVERDIHIEINTELELKGVGEVCFCTLTEGSKIKVEEPKVVESWTEYFTK